MLFAIDINGTIAGTDRGRENVLLLGKSIDEQDGLVSKERS